MKTTIDLPEELLIEAKKKAAEERTTLRKLVTQGLRQVLDRDDGPGEVVREVRFVTVDGGLPPGLDVSDRAAMHEWLQGGS